MLLNDSSKSALNETKYRSSIEKKTDAILTAFEAAAHGCPKQELASQREDLRVHRDELREALLRSIALVEDRRAARVQALALKERTKMIELGQVPGGLKALLQVRSRQFDRDLVETRTKRALRNEKKNYVKAIAKHLVGTKAFSRLLGDLAAPFLKDLETKVGGDLVTAEQHLARGKNGVAAALKETKQGSLQVFLVVAEDWGLCGSTHKTDSGASGSGVGESGSEAAEYFTREASRVTEAAKSRHSSTLSRALQSQHLTHAAAQLREESELRSQRLVVDNDYAMYHVGAPFRHPDEDFRPTRAEMETGHFLTVYSAVTRPEQHAVSPTSHAGKPPEGGALWNGRRASSVGRRGAGGGGGQPGWGATTTTRGHAVASVGQYDGGDRRGRQDPRLKMAAWRDGDHGFVSVHRKEGAAKGERHGFLQLHEDKHAAMRHESCVAPYAGGRVVVHALRARPDLNGCVGEAVAFCEMSGRYIVQLDDGRRLKLEAVKLCGHCQDPHDGPCAVCALMPDS